MSLAYAHSGETHPGASPANVSLLGDWAFDPAFLLLVLLAALYFKGYVRYRLRGGRVFPLWRPLLFALGVGVATVALLSPIKLLAELSFTWHMVQHDLLMLVAVPLVMLGAPFIPVVRGLPPWVRRRVFIPLARQGPVRRLAIFLTRPVPALIAFEGSILLWHLPGFYDTALFAQVVHYGQHATFIAGAMLFWWNLIRPYPFAARLHPLLRMAMLFGASVVNGGLSALIVFSDQVLYGYAHQPGFWGLTMLADQELGSALMWVMGGMWRLGALTLIFIAYAYEENAKEPSIVAERQRRRARALDTGAPQGA